MGVLLPIVAAALLTAVRGVAAAQQCANISGTWHGHPKGSGRILAEPLVVTMTGARAFVVDQKSGSVDADGVHVTWGSNHGALSANKALNASAPGCTRIDWEGSGHWCREPWCEWVPPAPAPTPPLPPPPPPTPPPPGAMNVLFIAVDDLRAQYGRSFKTPEVLTPRMDAFFLDGGGSAMQHSYVQVAVCGPSRSSMLTGRRPDSTHVGTGLGGWCWCQRSGCSPDALFITLPTYLRRHGFETAGNGKLFHPDACHHPFTHASGDDPRAWSYGPYGVEANRTQEAWGTIPGPHDPVFNGTMGLSFMESPLPDEETTDGMLATGTVQRLANFSREGIGKAGAGRPFFLATGFHKPVRCSCTFILCLCMWVPELDTGSAAASPPYRPEEILRPVRPTTCEPRPEPAGAHRLQGGEFPRRRHLRAQAVQLERGACLCEGRARLPHAIGRRL